MGRCVATLRRVFIFVQPQVYQEAEGNHGEKGVMMERDAHAHEPRAAALAAGSLEPRPLFRNPARKLPRMSRQRPHVPGDAFQCSRKVLHPSWQEAPAAWKLPTMDCEKVRSLSERPRGARSELLVARRGFGERGKHFGLPRRCFADYRWRFPAATCDHSFGPSVPGVSASSAGIHLRVSSPASVVPRVEVHPSAITVAHWSRLLNVNALAPTVSV